MAGESPTYRLRLSLAASAVGALLGSISALAVLFQLGYVFFVVENDHYEIRSAEQDARVCEYTANCDVDRANQAVSDMKEENRQLRAVHWFRAGIAALSLVGSGLLLMPEAIQRVRQPKARSVQSRPKKGDVT